MPIGKTEKCNIGRPAVPVCVYRKPDSIFVNMEAQKNEEAIAGDSGIPLPADMYSDLLFAKYPIPSAGRPAYYFLKFRDLIGNGFIGIQPLQQSGETAMNIETRTIGDVRIIDWKGRITLGDETMAIRNKVREMVSSGAKKMILNLAEVPYIDSSGVGELVSTYTTVTNAGGQLKLLNLTKKIHELLAITKLLTVFEVFDNEKTAVGSFR